MRTPLMYRFGKPAVQVVEVPVQTFDVTVHPAPLFVSMTIPLRKPPPVEKLPLHGPHHPAATYSVPLIVTPSRAVTCAAVVAPVAVRASKIFIHDVVPAIPASEFQTTAPPASRWLELVRSIAIGAMKRGFGSAGTMNCQFFPPSVDLRAVRPTYSVMTLSDLAGSTRV